VVNFTQLSPGIVKSHSRIPHDFSAQRTSRNEVILRKSRRDKVRAALEKLWKRYRNSSNASLVLHGNTDIFGGPVAAFVDTLDTLRIMAMKNEFGELVAAVLDIDFRPVLTQATEACTWVYTNSPNGTGARSLHKVSMCKRDAGERRQRFRL
jgi:hypothetical protein